MGSPDNCAKSHYEGSHDNSSPTCKTPLQAAADDGGHGNEAEKLKQPSPSLSAEDVKKSAPNNVEFTDKSKEQGNIDDTENVTVPSSPRKHDSFVVSIGTQEDNHANTKSPSPPGNLHVVSVEITPERKLSLTASKSCSHSNKDVDDCVVPKKGVCKQGEIKYVDDSSTDADSKASLTPDNQNVFFMETDQSKLGSTLNEKEQREIFGNPGTDEDKPVPIDTLKCVSIENMREYDITEVNRDRNMSMNSSHGLGQKVASGKDKLLNGGVTTKAFVVEDMSNVDENMPITKL